MSLVQSMSSVDRHCGGMGERHRSAIGCRESLRSYHGDDNFAHCEEQRWDGSAALQVDHGEEAGEVAFSGSSKEQSTRDDVTVVV